MLIQASFFNSSAWKRPFYVWCSLEIDLHLITSSLLERWDQMIIWMQQTNIKELQPLTKMHLRNKSHLHFFSISIKFFFLASFKPLKREVQLVYFAIRLSITLLSLLTNSCFCVLISAISIFLICPIHRVRDWIRVSSSSPLDLSSSFSSLFSWLSSHSFSWGYLSSHLSCTQNCVDFEPTSKRSFPLPSFFNGSFRFKIHSLGGLPH